MTDLGLSLSSEQHPPNELVDMAIEAEDAGFDFVMVSDHFHPWLEAQGESPFAWSVLGAIARETDSIEIVTGVTCPTIRYHPAIMAQATATVAAMSDGRFGFGVGTGENLNEHVTGARWPGHGTRLEMLEEAIDVVRKLWTGEQVDHDGKHYTVENARVYTLPEESPPVYVGAGGPQSAKAAGEIGDGLVSTAPKESVVDAFESANGDGDRPRYGQMNACYAESKEEARQIAHDNWRNGGVPGELGQELPTPKHFDQAAQLVDPEKLGSSMSLATDADAYLESVRTYEEAGFDHVTIHQVNPDADGQFQFFEEEIIPEVS